MVRKELMVRLRNWTKRSSWQKLFQASLMPVSLTYLGCSPKTGMDHRCVAMRNLRPDLASSERLIFLPTIKISIIMAASACPRNRANSKLWKRKRSRSWITSVYLRLTVDCKIKIRTWQIITTWFPQRIIFIGSGTNLSTDCAEKRTGSSQQNSIRRPWTTSVAREKLSMAAHNRATAWKSLRNWPSKARSTTSKRLT